MCFMSGGVHYGEVEGQLLELKHQKIFYLLLSPPQLWRCIMGSIDLSKKQDLAAEQALRLLKVC